MTTKLNLKQSVSFNQYNDAVEISLNSTGTRDREGRQIVILSDDASPKTTTHIFPFKIVETLFVKCLCIGDTRGSQSLSCLNRNFNENIRKIVSRLTSKPLHQIPSSRNLLIKVKSIIPDKNADKIFIALNVFLIWSRNVKMGFFLTNNPQDVSAIDQKKFYSVIANDFSSALLPQGAASRTLTNLLSGINLYLKQVFPQQNTHFSYPQMLANENSLVTERDLFNRMEALFDAAGEYVIRHVGGCSIVDPDFKIQYRDTTTQEMHTMDILPHTCINYAFYQMHEWNALPIVFENYLFQKSSDLFPFLLNVCGYRPVKNARKGDLICYFNKDIWSHFGRMESSNIVHSQWNQLRPAFAHPIEFVPGEYGRKYLLLRKPSSSQTQKWEFDSEKMEGKRIRGHDEGNIFKFKFNNLDTNATSFSDYMTLCGRSFILYGIQKGEEK